MFICVCVCVCVCLCIIRMFQSVITPVVFLLLLFLIGRKIFLPFFFGGHQRMMLSCMTGANLSGFFEIKTQLTLLEQSANNMVI